MITYPELPAAAIEEAEELMYKFKEHMLKLCDDTLGELYVNIAGYIESDAWNNFRQDILNGLKGYPNAKLRNTYDFVQIRKRILEENRAEIIEDLNQDAIMEIENLKRLVEILKEQNDRY